MITVTGFFFFSWLGIRVDHDYDVLLVLYMLKQLRYFDFFIYMHGITQLFVTTNFVRSSTSSRDVAPRRRDICTAGA